MNFSNYLTLSLCLLLTGATTGAAQDTIPTPPGEGKGPQLGLQQWVQLNADGLLIGQIAAVDDGPVGRCDVALVTTDNVVKQFSSDEDGKVTIRGVPPGLYAMAVRGKDLVATYALHVVGRDVENVSLDAAFTVVGARIDARKFYAQIVRYIPIEPAPAYTTDPAEVQAAAAGIGPAGLARVRQVDGGLEGCLFGAGMRNGNFAHAPQTYVFVLREGLEVARVVTDSQGCYRIDDLAPGRYSFIAVGQSGVAATGFELVPSGATADAGNQDSPFKLVSAVQPPGAGPPSQFNIQLAPPQAAMTGFESFGPPEGGPGEGGPFPLPPGEFLPPPGGGGFAGGGGAGGGFGGGGAGGGGGGIGGLLGIAGLAAGIAALADDDDFDPPSPASPAVPGVPPGPPAGIPPGPPAGVPPTP